MEQIVLTVLCIVCAVFSLTGTILSVILLLRQRSNNVATDLER